jgi:hypothetical protein
MNVLLPLAWHLLNKVKTVISSPLLPLDEKTVSYKLACYLSRLQMWKKSCGKPLPGGVVMLDWH